MLFSDDTVSFLFKEANLNLCRYAETYLIICNAWGNKTSGWKVGCFLYNSKEGKEISKLRRLLKKKVNTDKFSVRLEWLPLMLSTLCYHSLWVYYQITEWLGRLDVDGEKWGCCKSIYILLRRTMNDKPATDSFLKMICCKRGGDFFTLWKGYHCSRLRVQCQINSSTFPSTFLQPVNGSKNSILNPLGVYHGGTPWSPWTKQIESVGKNGCRQTCLDKSLSMNVHTDTLSLIKDRWNRGIRF